MAESDTTEMTCTTQHSAVTYEWLQVVGQMAQIRDTIDTKLLRSPRQFQYWKKCDALCV